MFHMEVEDATKSRRRRFCNLHEQKCESYKRMGLLEYAVGFISISNPKGDRMGEKIATKSIKCIF